MLRAAWYADRPPAPLARLPNLASHKLALAVHREIGASRAGRAGHSVQLCPYRMINRSAGSRYSTRTAGGVRL
jgi:hypothetical protein